MTAEPFPTPPPEPPPLRIYTIEACPPREHASYGSRMLATNAATLHYISYPLCPGLHLLACGDHWHWGHPSRTGERCRAVPEHAATRARYAARHRPRA